MHLLTQILTGLTAATALLTVRLPPAPFNQQKVVDLDELICQLYDPETHRRAMDELATLEPSVVLPRLGQAIRTDAMLLSVDWLRGAAYSVLLRVDVERRGPTALYVLPDQVALILNGLEDKDRGVRSICLQAVAKFDNAYDAEVVQHVVPILDTEEPLQAAAAAGILGRLGLRAEVALPSLSRVLVDESPAAKERWERARLAEPTRQGDRDPEVLVRQAAASARIEISGLTTDLAIYPTLDALGRHAGVYALQGPIVQILSKEQPYPLPLAADELHAVLGFVGGAALDEQLPLTARRMALHQAGWIALSPLVPDVVALKAIEYVRALGDHSDDEPVKGLRPMERYYLDRWSLSGR